VTPVERRLFRRALIATVAVAVLSRLALDPAWALTVDERSAVRWLLAVLWAVTGVWTLRAMGDEMGEHIDPARRVAAHVAVAAGGVVLALIVLGVLGISASSLLIGGAATGVIVGLAAQSSLGNLFAGLVLIFLRPYLPGDHVRLRSASFAGGEYGGTVSDLNLFYTVLADGSRRVIVPNASALSAAAVITPGPRWRLDVTLPAGCDVDGARRSLRTAVPGAELAISRWAPDGIQTTLDLPAQTSWAPIARWLDSLSPGPWAPAAPELPPPGAADGPPAAAGPGAAMPPSAGAGPSVSTAPTGGGGPAAGAGPLEEDSTTPRPKST
jgi:small conductance mechanosensitive channel